MVGDREEQLRVYNYVYWNWFPCSLEEISDNGLESIILYYFVVGYLDNHWHADPSNTTDENINLCFRDNSLNSEFQLPSPCVHLRQDSTACMILLSPLWHSNRIIPFIMQITRWVLTTHPPFLSASGLPGTCRGKTSWTLPQTFSYEWGCWVSLSPCLFSLGHYPWALP